MCAPSEAALEPRHSQSILEREPLDGLTKKFASSKQLVPGLARSALGGVAENIQNLGIRRLCVLAIFGGRAMNHAGLDRACKCRLKSKVQSMRFDRIAKRFMQLGVMIIK